MTRPALQVLGLLFLVSSAGTTGMAGAQSATRPTAATGAVCAPSSANCSVRGRLVDAASGQPVEHASIALRNKGATAVVAGAIVDGGDAFDVRGLRPGTYAVRITSMGFAPIVREIIVSTAAPTADLGVVKMTRVTVSLQTVEVNTMRSAVTVESDRTSFHAKQVAPAATNASEVLENVPAVQVDADGTVSYRGNPNVVVQINGRPSPMTGTQLGSFLKSLPAGVVDRVEVIPNPSAKYDPEGMAGILNIVLKQNTDLGLSGGVDGSASKQRYNASGHLGYQGGPLTLFSSYGYTTNERPTKGIDDRTRYDANLAPVTATDQLISSRARDGGHNLTTTAEYRLNARDLVTSSIVVNSRTQRDASTTLYTDWTGTGSLLDRYDGLRDQGGSGSTFDYDATFKRTFAPRKHELSMEARFNRNREQDATTAWRRDVDASATAFPTQTLTLGEIDGSVALTKQLTVQTDYVRPIGSAKLETGGKANTRWLDRDYTVQTDSLGSGAWTPSALSNAIRFDETVTAVYGLLSGKLGRAELQGGLRGEIAARDFTLAGSGARVPYRYGSLFPSANVLYNLSSADQLKLSYSRRIRRPGTQELNPFPVFMGNQNVFLGNPALGPEYTDAVELGYSRTGSLGMLQVNPFARHTTNAINFIVNPTDTVAGRELTSISFHNVASTNTWGTDLLGSVHVGSRLSGFVGGNVFRMVTDAGAQTAAAASGTTWSARANLSATVLPTVTVQGSYFYRAPMNFAGGRFLSMQMTTLTLRKKLDGDNAALTFRVSDPFSTGQFGAYGLNGSVRQLTQRSFGMRAAYIGYQYSYGRPPKIRQPDQGAQQQNTPGFP